jgi:hypothetical protein
VLTNSVVKPWARQQESFLLGVSPEVLAEATDKLLWRLGLQSMITANLVEGYGYRGTAQSGDANGSLAAVRRRFDGAYQHVGELSMATVHEVDVEQFSLVQIQREQETFRTEEHLRHMRELPAPI